MLERRLLMWAGAGFVTACAISSPGFEGKEPPAPAPAGSGAVQETTLEQSQPPPPEPPKTVFYAHDDLALYQVDPADPKLGISKLGDFDCIVRSGNPAGSAGAMTDVAISKDGKLYGLAAQMVFLDMKIEAGKVQCLGQGKALTADGVDENRTRFYGASFAPQGVLDPNGETLIVGNTAGELYAVDTTSGALTLVGEFGNVPKTDGNGHSYKYAGKPWSLSGDIVFMENKGQPVGFATVRDCKAAGDTCNEVDTLIQLDLTRLSKSSPGIVTKSVRGQILRAKNCADNTKTGYGNMFGIAARGTDVVGFSREGFIVNINNNDGTACLVADHTGLLKNGGFKGAGVTTIVEVEAPGPK